MGEKLEIQAGYMRPTSAHRKHGVLKVIADLRKSRKSTAKPAKDAEKCLFFSVISAISPGGTPGRCAVKMSFPENRLDFENTLSPKAAHLDETRIGGYNFASS